MLEDLAGNSSQNPIVIQVSCPAGSLHPLCYEEPEEEAVVADPEEGITKVESIADIATAAADTFTLDYEETVTLSLEATAPPPDPALEDDDDFEDVPGVLTEDQAAAAVEEILAAGDAPQEFDETLIPTGGVELTEEEKATASPELLADIARQSAYAGALARGAAQKRAERAAAGFTDDKPPAVEAPPAASPTGELEIRTSATTLFGDADVSRLRRLFAEDASDEDRRRVLQDGGFNLDVRRFMSFDLVRGRDSAAERRLRYTPRLSGFEGGVLKIQFDFADPLYVSVGTTPDRIVAKFTDPRLLMDPTTGMFVQTPGIISELPRMLLSDDATEVLGASSYLVASATNTLIIVLILLAFSLTAMTKSIWQFVNTIQLLAYLRWLVEWPANGELAF